MDYARYGRDEAYTKGCQEAMRDYVQYGRKPAAPLARRILKRKTESPWELAYWQGYVDYLGPRREVRYASPRP